MSISSERKLIALVEEGRDGKQGEPCRKRPRPESVIPARAAALTAAAVQVKPKTVTLPPGSLASYRPLRKVAATDPSSPTDVKREAGGREGQ